MLPEVVVLPVGNRPWQEIWAEIKEELPAGFAGRPQFKEEPLANIVRHLESLHCAQVVVGYPFWDEDYVHDYLHGFGGSFEDYGKACVRLHFFTKEPTLKPNTIVSQLQEIKKKQSQGYLGFMVVRPTGEACVGRTILQAPHSSNGAYIHVQARYACHLFGAELKVAGTPFMQQDQSSHVCAGAALWGLCYDLHRRYHTPRLFPHQIIDIATRFDPPLAYKWGLSPQHASQVLRHVGCANDRYFVDLSVPKKTEDKERLLRELIDVIYGYVQSNLPVYIAYWPYDDEEGHAVLIAGHDLESKPLVPKPAAAPGAAALMAAGQWSSEYVKTFFCQDDARGPYQELRVWRDDPKQWLHKNLPKEKLGIKENGVPILQRAKKIVILPGLSEDVRMTYRDAKQQVDAWFQDHAAALQEELAAAHLSPQERGERNDWLEDLREAREICRHRLYLTKLARFREQVLDSDHGRTGLGDEVVKAYCQLPLPPYVWVCDLCDTEPDAAGRYNLIGEILLNATAPKFDHDLGVIAARLHDRMIYRRENEWLKLRDQQYYEKPLHYAPRNPPA